MKFFAIILLIVSVESYFDAQLDRFEVLYQNEKFTDWKGLKVKKLNKTTRALVGEIKFFIDFDNDINVEVKSYKKQGKKFKKIILMIKYC